MAQGNSTAVLERPSTAAGNESPPLSLSYMSAAAILAYINPGNTGNEASELSNSIGSNSGQNDIANYLTDHKISDAQDSINAAQSIAKEMNGDKILKVVNNGMDRVLVIQHGNNIVLDFCGTERGNIPQLLNDLDATSTSFLNGEAHSGFVKALNNRINDQPPLKDQIEAAVHEAQAKNPELQGAKISTVGHSRGAALALLFAMETSLNINGSVCALGSPATVNQPLAAEVQKKFGNRYINLVDSNDPVPELIQIANPLLVPAGPETKIFPDGHLASIPTSERSQNAVVNFIDAFLGIQIENYKDMPFSQIAEKVVGALIERVEELACVLAPESGHCPAIYNERLNKQNSAAQIQSFKISESAEEAVKSQAAPFFSPEHTKVQEVAQSPAAQEVITALKEFQKLAREGMNAGAPPPVIAPHRTQAGMIPAFR